MPIIRLARVSLTYGHQTLLDGVDLELRRGERVCLLGRNGEGKSSLMSLLAGDTAPDDGTRWVRPATSVAHLAQEVDGTAQGTVFEVVAAGLGELGRLTTDYHHAASELAHQHSDAGVRRLAERQHALEAAGGWEVEQRVETILSQLRLDADAPFETLSGGWRRRTMLARALVVAPDLLLLDEPTNHLDIDAITGLEEIMLAHAGSLLFISHDRAFVRRLSTRILELDRGRLSSWPGDYDNYLRRKTAQLEVEAKHAAQFDKKLAEEEQWIRRGIKARRTRNEGRVHALEELRRQHRARRERSGSVELELDEAERSGRIVFEAKGVDKSFDETTVLRDFSVRVMRGDRFGIIGPNGAGKTTLIKVLLGELEPDAGSVRHGTKLEVAYFDQDRAPLDPDASVMNNVAGGNQSITIGGRSRHVASYLRDFLFPRQRLTQPVSTLSGGERNRLLLAKLLARPANLLVLDEPTNDLDLETLELLEELIAEFNGTLLVVSHDRAFLDNVVTDVLVFEGDGRVGEYAGGYGDWLERQRRRPEPAEMKRSRRPAGGRRSATPEEIDAPPAPQKPTKLSYKLQRELEALPGRIEALEAEQATLHESVNAADFYTQPREQIEAALARLDAIARGLEECYERWATLES